MKKILTKIHLPLWLEILLIVVLLLRIPSLLEPFSYGDEMIYLTLGHAIKKGLLLYRDIHDNKPPLLYLLAALAGNVFWFKAILAFWSLATITFFYKLTAAILKNKKIVAASCFVFAILTTLPTLEGNIANAENFMIGATILAIYLLVSRANSPKVLVLSGALFSIATLFKIPAAFDILAIILFWLFTTSLGKSIKPVILLSLGFALPLAASFLWAFLAGALPDYLRAAFFQNVSYLSSWGTPTLSLPARAGLAATFTAILFIFRKKLSAPFLFSCLWLVTSLFAVTLSSRPYPHYFLQAAPAISILIGFLVSSQKIEQTLAIFPLLVATSVPVYFKFYYYPTFTYYQRFIQLLTRQIDSQTYLTRFDASVPRNYQIASLIDRVTHPDARIFVWGDSPPIYALTRRLPPIKFVATYHINDYWSGDAKNGYSELLKALNQAKPSAIVILPNSQPPAALTPLLTKHYLLIATIDAAEVYKLIAK